jgi:heptosyltransferase-3
MGEGQAMRTAPRSVLIVVTRRIGDVLLATPLARSVKRAWPDCALDLLVFEGTQDAVKANPDFRRVITVPARPAPLAHLAFCMGIAQRYDLALSTQHGDRATMYAFLAGRWRAGLLEPDPKQKWKRPFLQRWVPFDDLDTHTVRMNLALAEVLGIPASAEVVVSWTPDEERAATQLIGKDTRPLAVLHPYPKFNYKMWRPEAWIELGRHFAQLDYAVAITGGRDGDELAYDGRIVRALPGDSIDATGRLSFGASASLVSRAKIYIGPDTALTHAAAALGVPTVALYGPTNCVKWGPWPRGQSPDANPWRRHGTQRRRNVVLLQGNIACVPCHLEGCDRHVESHSDCLQELPVSRVIAAAEELAAGG